MKDAAIEKLSQSSQPKGAVLRSAKEAVDETLIKWHISDNQLRDLFIEAMQSYASQQCAEKDKEIAELKKQPEVSEDRMKVLRSIVHTFPPLVNFDDFKVWVSENPGAQKLISQLFEPQPVQGEKKDFGGAYSVIP
jgi:uncharacterized protein YhaN